MPIPTNWHIVFIHIQKTGGTTLDTILTRNMGDLQNNSILYEPELIEKSKSAIIKDLNKIQSPSYIRGIVGYGISAYVRGRHQYIILLRHPVDRVLSLYYFLSHYSQSPSHKEVKKMSLDDFVTSRITFDVTDGQTRQLASKDGFPISLEQNLTIADLDRAKRRIQEKSILVGITEEFDKSLLLFAHELGLQKITYKKRNVGRHRPPISEIPKPVLRKIEQQNSYDILLYDYARQIFHKNIDYFGEELFSKKLSRFRSEQELFQANYIKDYTDYGKEKIQTINNALYKMGSKRIAIYGAGEHTERMMEDTILLEKNIVALVDSETSGSLKGLRIINPSKLNEYKPEIVIISSFSFQEEIAAILLEDIKYTGELMRIYNKSDTQPFYIYKRHNRPDSTGLAIP